jgi:hypothetical protein
MATQKKTLIQLFASLRGIFPRRSRPTPLFPNPDRDENPSMAEASIPVPPSGTHLLPVTTLPQDGELQR